MTGVEVRYRSRRLSWLATISDPAAPQISDGQRSGEVADPLVLADDMLGARANGLIGDRQRVVQTGAAQRTDHSLRSLAFGDTIARTHC